MEPKDLIRNLIIEYYAKIAADPDWEAPTLFDYLIKQGVDPDDIWEESPQIGYDANQPEPEWV